MKKKEQREDLENRLEGILANVDPALKRKRKKQKDWNTGDKFLHHTPVVNFFVESDPHADDL